MLAAAADWSNLTVAGAFMAGTVLGAFGVIRVTRYVLEYLRNERRGD